MLASSLMHWILSQSLFLVRVDFLDKNGVPGTSIGDYNGSTISLPGYLPGAVLGTIILGSVMLLAIFLMSFPSLASAMPLAGSKRSAICAACQRPDDDEEAASKAVTWGAVSHAEEDRPGHWCVTSFVVEEPVVGGLYL